MSLFFTLHVWIPSGQTSCVPQGIFMFIKWYNACTVLSRLYKYYELLLFVTCSDNRYFSLSPKLPPYCKANLSLKFDVLVWLLVLLSKEKVQFLPQFYTPPLILPSPQCTRPPCSWSLLPLCPRTTGQSSPLAWTVIYSASCVYTHVSLWVLGWTPRPSHLFSYGASCKAGTWYELSRCLLNESLNHS